MSNSFLLLITIPIGLAIVQTIKLDKVPLISKYGEYLRSFAAGFSVAYVLLILLPELPELGQHTGIETAIFSLLGFSLFHEAHKFVFRVKERSKKKAYLDEIHFITAGLYSFLITFYLVELAKESYFQGMIIAFIIASHAVFSEISQAEVNDKSRSNTKTGVIVFLTFMGGLLSIFNLLSISITTILFSLTAGAIIYIAIREEIPNDDRGKPFYFLFGSIVLILIRHALL